MYKRFLAAAALAAGLGACGSFGGAQPAVVSASADAVTLRFQEGYLSSATERAQQMCGTYQRSAELRTVTPGQGNERIGVWDCRY